MSVNTAQLATLIDTTPVLATMRDAGDHSGLRAALNKTRPANQVPREPVSNTAVQRLIARADITDIQSVRMALTPETIDITDPNVQDQILSGLQVGSSSVDRVVAYRTRNASDAEIRWARAVTYRHIRVALGTNIIVDESLIVGSASYIRDQARIEIARLEQELQLEKEKL